MKIGPRCSVCGKGIRRGSLATGKCARCRAERKRPGCPRCGSVSRAHFLAQHGVCRVCRDQTEHREITGRERDRVIADFLQWFANSGTAWDRAEGNARLFIA